MGEEFGLLLLLYFYIVDFAWIYGEIFVKEKYSPL